VAIGIASVAGPEVVPRINHHPGSNGIALDVSITGEQVLLGPHHGGFVPPFPKGTGSLVYPIKIGHVPATRALDGHREAVRLFLAGEQMNVVGHQDIRVDGYSELLGRTSQAPQEVEPISIGTKHVLLVHPANIDVRGVSGDKGARLAGHALLTPTVENGVQPQ
jgi:hypothetical protein